MSKAGKSKITLELPKAKNLSDRLSVFQRLGNRGAGLIKEKTRPGLDKDVGSSKSETSTSKQDDIQQPEEPFPNASLKLQLVRQKAAEIMDSKRKQEVAAPPTMAVIKKVRKIRVSSPSSDSSSSTSGSSSSSSSSSPKRKAKKRQIRKRPPSSSSDEVRERKVNKKKSHKKSSELKRLHHKKSKEVTRKLIKRAISPPASYTRRQESESPERKPVVKVRKEKVYRHESVEQDREIYEKQRIIKERMRSPSPRMLHRSRSPRPMKRISPERRSPPRSYRSRERSDDRSPYKESRVERERRERSEYERMRQKEREEALARCQERQRERERLKQLELEKMEQRHGRPRSIERGRPVHRAGSSRERSTSYTRPPSRDEREYDRRYESPVHRSWPIEDRSPVGREYVSRRDESPYVQERAPHRYDYDDPPPRHEKVRRPHGEFDRSDHRQHDDRRPNNYERTEQRDWDRPGRDHPPPHKEWTDRRGGYEDKEHWNKERPHHKQYHDSPKPYNDPHHQNRQQEMHHSPHSGQSGPSRGPPKKYAMQQSGPERGPNQSNYRHPRPNMMNPRHERPESQSYRPRMHHNPGGPRPSFRPTGGPRAPGNYNPRHQFHPNISYFPTRHKGYQQQSGSPLQQMGQGSSNQQMGETMMRPSRQMMLKRQDGAEEEDHLSEISDEGDDILGKNETRHLNRVRLHQRQQRQLQDQNIQGQMSGEPKNVVDPSVKEEATGIDTKSHANKQLQEEMELDFEEISDGELDEENKIKSLGDALGVDWASIVEESKRKVKDDLQLGINSAKQRLQPHRVLLEIGVSARMAGKEFAEQVIKDAYSRLQEEITTEVEQKALILKPSEPLETEIKQEPMEQEIKEEKPDIADLDLKIKEKLPYSDTDLIAQPYAFAQAAYKQRLITRKNLLINAIGPYSRALSARQDLKIRRHLCGLPEEELIDCVVPTPVVVTQPGNVDAEALDSSIVEKPSSLKLALNMFKKAVQNVC